MLKRVHLLGDMGYDLLIQAVSSDLASSFMQNGAPNVMDWLSRIAKWTAFMDNDHKEYLSSNETLNVVEHIDYHRREEPRV